ncbi:hypothetical protein N752_21730 [Desulforamulus aquiferis]|nr:hypothetical protein N752_21730 [Desulforamulus aquiferis]
MEEQGKVFPFSNQASSVLDVLRHEMESIGVKVIVEAETKGIKRNNRGFQITLKGGEAISADKVIIATGGKAAPNLGTTGSGYLLAQTFGHSLVEPFPALVQLKLNYPYLKQIKGIKFDGDAEIIVGNKTMARARGEILFTEYGISGPPIFQVSRSASEWIKKGKQVWLKVVIINHLSREEIISYTNKRFKDNPGKTVSFSFVGFINKQLIPVFLKQAGIADLNKRVSELSSAEKDGIISLLQDWRFEVEGTNTWSAAQTTAGGIDVKDIDPRTMQSKLVEGLYFGGEVMDIDGDCGGYNLQWAWSSGYLAGISAAKSAN